MTQFDPHIVQAVAVAEADATPDSPRLRVGNIVLTTLTVVVIAGAIAAVVLGMQSSSSASDARDRTAALHRDRRAAETRQHDAEHTMSMMNAAAAKVPLAFTALAQSLDTVVSSQHNVVEVHNRGAAVYNAGDERGLIAVYTGDGAAAIVEFDAKAATAKTALDNAAVAAHDLEEALNG